jgi:tRNA(fMet)-specific endonuclease VapC
VTLIDTSALIEFLIDGEESGTVERLVSEGRAATSAICVYELLAGVKSGKHRADREMLISSIEVISIDTAIARRAATLFTDLRARGITIDNEDLLIGATALESDLPLLTCNATHFAHIPGVRLE